VQASTAVFEITVNDKVTCNYCLMLCHACGWGLQNGSWGQQGNSNSAITNARQASSGPAELWRLLSVLWSSGLNRQALERWRHLGSVWNEC
jgi:hypothetical protein